MCPPVHVHARSRGTFTLSAYSTPHHNPTQPHPIHLIPHTRIPQTFSRISRGRKCVFQAFRRFKIPNILPPGGLIAPPRPPPPPPAASRPSLLKVTRTQLGIASASAEKRSPGKFATFFFFCLSY